MGTMKTPGVYVVEKNAFGSSTVEVATAVPAFVGYTQKAANGNVSLLNRPFRISSMAEFRTYFGGAPTPVFSISEQESGAEHTIRSGETFYKVELTSQKFTMYYQMLSFFANGGGSCYIVSVGDYEKDLSPDSINAGIDALEKEQEPTMLVCPESVCLSESDYKSVVEKMLSHCGSVMKNRIAILDVYDGWRDRKDPSGDVVSKFRDNVGGNFLDYATAYYPWVNTSINQERELSFENLDESFKAALDKEMDEKFNEEAGTIKSLYAGDFAEMKDLEKSNLHKTLMKVSSLYIALQKEMCRQLNLLAPSAAMAGIFTMVDNTRGVWKAPANVTLNSAISPAVNLTNSEQEDLNAPLSGKALNAIRFFNGDGIKVWGARTLDGNSLDWRYINVRRTMIMLEESIKNAARTYVFEPNESNTWINMNAMISNFLNGIWKRGGLAGSTPEEAYSVHVGLGDTMTPADILEGIMRISVFVAVSRPAEFIEITFQQKMQES